MSLLHLETVMSGVNEAGESNVMLSWLYGVQVSACSRAGSFFF